jgi:hypothetical protein
LEENLCKLDFNFIFRFVRISKLLNDIHITMKGDSGWMQFFIKLPPFWSHEYKLESLKKHYHFKLQTMISICQGIKEIGGDGDLDLYVTVTLPSPNSTPLRTPFGSCKQPYMRSRG